MNHEHSGPRLRSCDLHSVAEAVDAFGEDDGLLACRIRPPAQQSFCSTAVSILAPCFTVPEGFYALVLSGGKDADFRGESATWPAGLHFGVPWLRVNYLVTKQSVVYNVKVKQCLTSDNVPVVVRATVVLRVLGDAERGEDPALVRKFVYEMGVRGLEAQLENSMEEGIRVMVRRIPHQTVYALTSGGGAVSLPPRHPPPLPLDREPRQTNRAKQGKSSAGMDRAAGRTNQSNIRINQVAPEVALSPLISATAENSPGIRPENLASVKVGDGGESTTSAAESIVAIATRLPPASASLPTIQRGLRASRIVPAEILSARERLLTADETQKTSTHDTSGVSAAKTLIVTGGQRRIHPEEGLLGEALDPLRGGGSTKGAFKTPLISRPAPPAINVDLSPSSSLSASSSLPKLELDVTRQLPVRNLNDVSGQPNSDGSPLGRNGEAKRGGGVEGARDSAYDCVEGSGVAAEALSQTVDVKIGRAEGGEYSSIAGGGITPENATPRTISEAAAAEALAATSLEGRILLGRQQSERMRDQVNRTLSPQGVEVTSVMVCSVELPQDIAEQMSGRTLGISVAEQQRAVKKAQSQQARHGEEIEGLHQMHVIERALAVREGDEELEKAKITLAELRARARALVASIQAASAVEEQRVASEATWEVSRSHLREAAEESSQACSSDRLAGILEAETEGFRTRRESEATLQVALNAVRAQESVAGAEGISAPMLRAARAHLVDKERLEVLKSLAKNNLVLVTSSPLVNATSVERCKPAEDPASAMTAFLVGEEGFKSQVLGASTSAVTWRGQLELGAQLAFARDGGRAAGFAVRLNPQFLSCADSCADYGVVNDDRGVALNDTRCVDDAGGYASSLGRAEACGRDDATKKGAGIASDGVYGRKEDLTSADICPGDVAGGRRSVGRGNAAVSTADCELCIVRDGVPYRLRCSV